MSVLQPCILGALGPVAARTRRRTSTGRISASFYAVEPRGAEQVEFGDVERREKRDHCRAVSLIDGPNSLVDEPASG